LEFDLFKNVKMKEINEQKRSNVHQEKQTKLLNQSLRESDALLFYRQKQEKVLKVKKDRVDA